MWWHPVLLPCFRSHIRYPWQQSALNYAVDGSYQACLLLCLYLRLLTDLTGTVSLTVSGVTVNSRLYHGRQICRLHCFYFIFKIYQSLIIHTCIIFDNIFLRHEYWTELYAARITPLNVYSRSVNMRESVLISLTAKYLTSLCSRTNDYHKIRENMYFLKSWSTVSTPSTL